MLVAGDQGKMYGGRVVEKRNRLGHTDLMGRLSGRGTQRVKVPWLEEHRVLEEFGRVEGT